MIEFQSNPEEIGIEDIKEKLAATEHIQDEMENFAFIMKVLENTIDFLKSSIVVYEVMLKNKERKSYPAYIFNQLEFMTYKARLTVNNLEKEYYLYEDYIVTQQTNKVSANEERHKKFATTMEEKSPQMEAIELKSFIDDNLHKIYSKHEFFMPMISRLKTRLSSFT